MKILIIGFAKIKYMPYLDLYLENTDRKKHEVHLIFWNRDLKAEDVSSLDGITLHEFRYFQPDDAPKLSKIGSFLKFRKFAKTVLKESFDFIVSLHSLPGIILFKELTAEYKNRYIYDYRDLTYEKFPLYKKAVHSLVKNSFKTFVSSDAFRKHLPESEKILTSHNVSTQELSYEASENIGKSEKLRIAFWGFIREEKLNKEIIKKLGADGRLELHYYGREQEIAESLKKYVSENNFKNVFFHGEYDPRDRYNFAERTDIIHNIYSDGNMMLAVSNKYYDGAIFKLPQLVMKGSFMAKNAEKAGIGLSVDPYSEDFAQRIFDYYKSINSEAFSENCQEELKRATEDNKKIIGIINSIGYDQ